MSALDYAFSLFTTLSRPLQFNLNRQTSSRPFIHTSANLPLLPLGVTGAVMRLEDQDDIEDADLEGLNEIQGGYTPYLGRLTAVACLGGLQFGWVSVYW